MRAGTLLLCAALAACVSAGFAALAWLGVNVREIRATREAEIRAARVVELTQARETEIFREWTRFAEALDAIPPEDFSEASVRAAASRAGAALPVKALADALPPSAGTPAELGEKFSAFRADGDYFLMRRGGGNGVAQGVVLSADALFRAFEAESRERLARTENAVMRVVPVAEARGFGVVRGLPGAKLEFDLAPRPHAESVAAERAVLLALAGAAAMLAAIFALAVRVFLLSEKRRLFASSVSHELKTPLAELRLCAETAHARCGDPAVRGELDRIRRSASELSDIVENLLLFSRMRSGKFRVPAAEISVDAFFRRVSDRIAERLFAADMDVIFDVEPAARERRLFVNAETLGRVLFNLADNAAKHARRDDGDNLVAFRARVAGRRLFIDVADEGPGIPPEVRARLFTPFAGGSASRGLGLGLAISARAARAFGGRLSLVKSGSAGTTFRLELPLLGK